MKRPIETLIAVVILASMLLAACGSGGSAEQPQDGTTGQANPADTVPAEASSGPLTATATSPISVQLIWTPIAGATGYTIEVSLGGGEALTLAELGASATTYEDFGVPEGFAQTYRLVAAGSGEEYSVTVATPLDANPYSVQPELQSAQPAIPGLDLGGLDLSNLDLSNLDLSSLDPSMFDPSNFDMSSIDENNFDPNAFLEEAGVSATIGPEGGALAATGADGTVYTLTIPTGALDEPTFLLMTPIASIGGFPFSGGVYGAVQIEPEGLELAVPAMLRIEPANGAGAAGDGLVNVAFGFEGDGSDFYLTPFYQGDSLARGETSTKLSDLLPNRLQAGPLAEIAARQLGPLGGGKATPAEVRDFAKKHTPSRPSSRAAQKAAVVQMDSEADDLTPIPRITPGTRLSQAAAAASNCSQLLQVLEDYSIATAEGTLNSMSPEGMSQLLNNLSAEAHAILKAENEKCIHPQRCAMALAGRLSDPRTPAEKNLANAYANKYPPKSDSTLKNVEEQRKACQLELEIESNLTLTTPDGGDGMLVRVRIPLKWDWDPYGDEAFLYGSGPVTYVDINMNAKKCTFTFTSGSTGRTRFRVDELKPLFEYDQAIGEWRLYDFNLRRWSIPGNPNDMIVTCEELQNGQLVKVARKAQLGGGTCDAWCGHFTASREDSPTIVGWDVTGSGRSTGEIATKTFNRQVPIPVPGATLTERTIFTLKRVK